ncbi:MAG: ABC transporter ATP-binding protein [Xanthomonadales bacterium]|nr:ABC transporter ATP-binding protein [Xanthomonadales bacterium]
MTGVDRTPDNPAMDESMFSALQRILGHISSKRRRQFWFIALLMLAGAVAELVTISAIVPFLALISAPERASDYPWLGELAENTSLAGGGDTTLLATIAFMLLVIIAATIRLVLARANLRFSFAIGRDLGREVYRRILYQPFRYHTRRNSSDVLAAVNKAQAVANGAVMPVIQGFSAFLIGIGILAALLVINATIALSVGVFLVGVYLLANRAVQVRLVRNGRIIAKAHAQRVKAIQEGTGGIRDVILEGAQAEFLEHFSEVEMHFRNAQASNGFMSQSPRFVIEAVGILVIAGLAFGLARGGGGLAESIPLLGALALGAQRLLPQGQQIYGAFSSIHGSRKMLADLLEFLELPEAPSLEPATAALSFDSRIEMRGVCYRHSDTGPWNLDSVNLSIEKGEKVVVLGETGAGKSTLADLLMGLLEPCEGEILVDGLPLGPTRTRAWQKNISHVPQHVFLLDASIERNISFGAGTVDTNRLRRAARQAEIADMIESLPEGYDSRVGERGAMLSGGERQRLGIARALYKKAQVLVLDEPTSAIDNETAQRILSNVERDEPELTIFMITHNPDAAASFSRRLEVRDGRVFELGRSG